MSKKFAMMVFSVLLASLGGVVRAEVEPVRIATVDMQQALRTVDAGKKAKSDLETTFNKKKAELQKEEGDIKKMHEEFQKQSLVLSDEARIKKQGEIQQRVMQLQEKTAQSQMEIQKKEADLTMPIIEKMRGIIADLAKAKGYSFVLEKNENTVLYSQEKDDLTQDVIKIFNKKSG